MRSWILAALATLVWSCPGALAQDGPAPGPDAFYSASLAEVPFTQGELPKEEYAWKSRWEVQTALYPWAVADGAGEAFFSSGSSYLSQGPLAGLYPEARLVVRGPAGQAVTGRLYLPKPDWSGMEVLRFRIEPKDASPEVRTAFFKAREAYYRRLADRGIPGGAWFRHQAALARREIDAEAVDDLSQRGDPRLWRGRQDDLESTYDLFTGGRALSENLQLDRALPSGPEAEETVPLSTIEGITVKAFDWNTKLAGAEPTLDALGALVPADQFAVFFPSFPAMIELIDEADRGGTPVLQWLEPRAEDAMTKDRYQKQLCLEMSALGRLLGPKVIAEVAFTGSDPYLREGTDVAILFHARPGMTAVLSKYLEGKQRDAEKSIRSRVTRSDQNAGFTVHELSAEDRSVSSFRAEFGDVIVVANSWPQLLKIAAAAKGQGPALASQDEYRFFRSRYVKGSEDETALLVLPDLAIRQWCSPRWRILESRRTRAAAVLAQLQAEKMPELIAGRITSEAPAATNLRVPGGGTFLIGPDGPRHTIYGTPGFLTPIAELPAEKVSKQEADLYQRWREGFQRNWSNFFDPIALRFSVQRDRIGIDVSVYPLIAYSEYRSFIDVAGKAGSLPPGAADLHPGALLHFAMSLDPQSEPMRELSNFAIGLGPQLKVNPLGWLGRTFAVYVDDDPIWAEIAKDRDWERNFEKLPRRLPIALWVEVKNPLGLAAFLTAVRGVIEQTAPGLTHWESLEAEGRPYVKISADLGAMIGTDEPTPEGEPSAKRLSIYYAATPRSLLITLDEATLKRALARTPGAKAPEATDPAPPPAPERRPWLGTSVGLQADARILDVFQDLLRDELQPTLQARAWGNLPILNEWKRLFPDQDPLQVHARFWGTTLLCPGGGSYAWNAELQTMESSAYGCPAAPKPGPGLPAAIQDLRFGNFGLTLENDGLRARAVLERAGR